MWQGYRGHSGPGLATGERPDSAIVRASGDHAAEMWRELARFAENVSRLDIQVTVQLPMTQRGLAREGYRAAIAYLADNDRAPQLRLITTHPVGDTLYIGSPKSDVMARLYDKAAESPNLYEPGTWRYEVEYKREAALSVCRTLQGAANPQAAIAATVFDHFAARGVAPRFPRGAASEIHATTRRRSVDETRLRWLESTVAPAVRTLLRNVPRSEVERALGLLAEGTDPDE
jgi:hypothetical protein